VGAEIIARGWGGTTAAVSQRGAKAQAEGSSVPLSLEARGRNDRMLEKAMQRDTVAIAMKRNVDAVLRLARETEVDLEAGALPQLSPRTAALATPGVPEVLRPKREMQMVVAEEKEAEEKDALPPSTCAPKDAASAYAHKRQGFRFGAEQLCKVSVMCVRPVPLCFRIPPVSSRRRLVGDPRRRLS
jgi:hypothetical protein